MPSDKASLAKRRYMDHIAVAKQLRIFYQFPYNTDVGTVGKLRKHHATNCGKARCLICNNPRRTWGRLTLKELSCNEAFAYDLADLKTVNNDTGL